MPNKTRLTISLPPKAADMVRARLETGEYRNVAEVLLEGLEHLDQPEVVDEAWLHNEVKPTIDRIRAGTEPLLSSDEVRKRLNAIFDRKSPLAAE